MEISEIAQEIERLKERNRRVEQEKAWEVSWARVSVIMVITYFTAAIFLLLVGAERPWLGAVVPALGFLLSTRSLPFIKSWWMKNK